MATLLIVGGADYEVIELNQQAHAHLRCEKSLAIVPGATHLFEETGRAGAGRATGLVLVHHPPDFAAGQQEGRIRQLQELLRTAKVGTAPTSSDTASPGMVLKLRYEGDNDTETVLLGSREEGNRGDLEVISPNSPLGAALLGAHAGDTREYALPDGGTMKVSLVSAEPFRA